MKRFVVTLMATLMLGGAASAQQAGNWIGFSAVLPLGVTGHYGLGGALGGSVDLRLSLQLALWAGLGLGVAVDGIYSFASPETPSAPYVGAGVSGAYMFGVIFHVLAWDVHGLAGYQHRLDNDWGVFGEVNLGFGTASVTALHHAQTTVGLTYALRLGANYHLR